MEKMNISLLQKVPLRVKIFAFFFKINKQHNYASLHEINSFIFKVSPCS